MRLQSAILAYMSQVFSMQNKIRDAGRLSRLFDADILH